MCLSVYSAFRSEDSRTLIRHVVVKPLVIGSFWAPRFNSNRPSLSAEVMCALVQVFVYCRLDYCNSLVTGAADVPLKRLYVQNAAAQLVSGTHCHDHITTVLTTLRWLPVRKRVMLQTVVLVWRCLNGTAPGCK